ncbi:hypothetical protein EUGRSUZ_H01504 [Eucalyptus grandis]|uniref:Uncharacterized protein n=1 Tax=Eucalyptus grandis TaxID=71139 RepID=A0ACC3JNU3_EUCGR|nr:hypothetical protein EUGRSUZ_H01504 [Eucalyptus grandis]
MPKTALSMLLLLAGMVLPILAAGAHKAVDLPCSQICRTGKPVTQNLTYPFGFSSGCPIQLNCTDDGDALIGEFRVQSASTETVTVTVTIEAECNRSFEAIVDLYGRNYAPIGENALLLNSCTQISPCDLPNTQVIQSQFQSLCETENKTNTRMSCYSEQANDYSIKFLNRSRLFALGCKHFLSSISAKDLNYVSVSLGVQMLQLEWWVNGDECECSQHADCVRLSGLPNGGGNGFRCKCRDGLLGDGFLAGTGCQRVLNMVLPLMVLLAVLMLILGVVYVIRRKRKFAEVLEDWERDYGPHRFKYKDLYTATKGFRNQELLGAGGFGQVYRGILPTSNIEIAVKTVSHESKQGMREFVAEIITIGRLRHRNLVALLGYCRRKRELLLVYDYMPNGSLDKYLYNQPKDVILVDWVFSCWDRGAILEARDPKLGLEFVEEEMELVLKLGLMCSHANPLMRPSMRQVLQYLEGDLPMPESSSIGISSAGSTVGHREGFDNLAYSSSVAESLLSGGR